MDVVWFSLAKRQLRTAFKYYQENASKKVALQISKGIVKQTIQVNNPFSGVVEERLASRPFEYRFLVYRHYKIYYFVTADLVLIAAVFDSRQDPNKLIDLL